MDPTLSPLDSRPFSAEACLKALADPARRELLRLLGEPRYFCRSAREEVNGICVGDLVQHLGLPQSTVSRHLAVLKQADLVLARSQGTWNYYVRNDETLLALEAWIRDLRSPLADSDGA